MGRQNFAPKVTATNDSAKRGGQLTLEFVTMIRCGPKARSHDPILKIRFLVPKTESRRSDSPISRFRFCCENVERSFAVCSHDPTFRTNKESSIWLQNDHRDIMQNFSAPFIFQEECQMKIEHVLFPSGFFFRIRDPCVGRSFSMCSHGPTFESFNFDVEFCRPVLPRNQILSVHIILVWDLCVFNLYNL